MDFINIQEEPQEIKEETLLTQTLRPQSFTEYIGQEITKANLASMPLVPVEQIVRFLDYRPDIKSLVDPFVVAEPLWDVV